MRPYTATQRTYQATHGPEDLAGGRVSREDHVAVLHALVNVCLGVLSKLTAAWLPVPEGRPRAIDIERLKPAALLEKLPASVGIWVPEDAMENSAEEHQQDNENGQAPGD